MRSKFDELWRKTTKKNHGISSHVWLFIIAIKLALLRQMWMQNRFANFHCYFTLINFAAHFFFSHFTLFASLCLTTPTVFFSIDNNFHSNYSQMDFILMRTVCSVSRLICVSCRRIDEIIRLKWKRIEKKVTWIVLCALWWTNAHRFSVVWIVTTFSTHNASLRLHSRLKYSPVTHWANLDECWYVRFG